jgi:Spy/CpxP family protein refolding chaperone
MQRGQMYTTLRFRAALIAAGMLFWAAGAHASTTGQGTSQDTTQRADSGATRMRRDRLADALKGIQLSNAQRAKVDSIRAKYRDSITALQPGPGMSQDKRQQFRNLMRQQFADIRNVLTSEQQQVFDKNVEQMRANRRRHGGGWNRS